MACRDKHTTRRSLKCFNTGTLKTLDTVCCELFSVWNFQNTDGYSLSAPTWPASASLPLGFPHWSSSPWTRKVKSCFSFWPRACNWPGTSKAVKRKGPVAASCQAGCSLFLHSLLPFQARTKSSQLQKAAPPITLSSPSEFWGHCRLLTSTKERCGLCRTGVGEEGKASHLWRASVPGVVWCVYDITSF